MSEFISLIIPTKDRPDDIRALFHSLGKQSRMPDEIIVVDGSDVSIEDLVSSFKSLPIKYLQVIPPSLPKQRNAGVANLDPSCSWIGFLDDDLVLEHDAIEHLECLVEQEKDLGGVGMSIINQPTSSVEVFNKVFLLSNNFPGSFAPSGFPVMIPCVDRDITVEWLYGGATFWSVDVFKEFSYDEWFKGTGYMEDVDFSYRVSRKYRLMVSSKARCNHFFHKIISSKQRGIGKWLIVSWWYFIEKHKTFKKSYVFWGIAGIILKGFLAAIVNRSKDSLCRVAGNLDGLVAILRGKVKDSDGFSK